MAVDFHTHVLPGIDDGSADVAESLQLLAKLSEQGIHTVAATPHFYANHDAPSRFLEKRRISAGRLLEAMGDGGDVQIRIGAEVHYFEGISDCDALEALTISGTRCVLVEMPMAPWSERMMRELENIHHKRGLIPVVAHVDRYIGPFRTYGIPERLAEMPVLVQANASFFIKRSTQRMALRLLRNGVIHLLGSDCHNMVTRKPNMKEAMEVITSKAGREAMEPIAALERILLDNGRPW